MEIKFMYLKILCPSLLQQFWKCVKWLYPYVHKSLVFVDEFLAQGLHLKSRQACSAGIRMWLSADYSSSSTLT